ncbi:uncharacterized protein LOC124156007 [Ischnura elegans]|uniref:uncharacterized protein LOC124156007 n=1 Tax=Ischnura elegans TaxID=197161 RepID=UPI001ED86F0E|nr:uncharacterized protein LOC124156007 [Ischnura elegans]
MCAKTLPIMKIAVAALVLLVTTRTFQPCEAHPRLLVTTTGGSASSEDSDKLANAYGSHGSAAEEPTHHPDYTVAIARNPFSVHEEKHLPKGHVSNLNIEDTLQKEHEAREEDEDTRVKRESGRGRSSSPKAPEWGDSLAEPSDAHATLRAASETSEEEEPTTDGGVVFGARIKPRDSRAQAQHFFPSFASLFSPPPPPPHTLLGYNHESSISRPRHPPTRSRGSGRSHFSSQHHYPGFESYSEDEEEEDDSFGLFQGSEHGTLSPRPPPPILQPPRAKLSYHSARQQQASANTDSKHTGLLGSGNFAVIRGGTYYDEKDKSASELRGSYYNDPYGNGHSGPSYHSNGYRGLPSNPRPRPGREHFADFRDFADITAPKPAFSQLVVVYAANQNGSGEDNGAGKNGSSTDGVPQKHSPPRNIIERLRLLDGEEGSEESESQGQDKYARDDVALWDGEGGNEEEDLGDANYDSDEDEGDLPHMVVVKVAPRPNNINEKLKLLDVGPSKDEEPQKKVNRLSLGKRKLALIKEKGKWVSTKEKRLSKDQEPLLALS